MAAHWRTTLLDFVNGAEDVGRIRSFQEVTAGSGFERAKDAVVVFINCKDEYLDGWAKLF